MIMVLILAIIFFIQQKPSKEKVTKGFLDIFYTTNKELATQQEQLVSDIQADKEIEPYYTTTLTPFSTDKAIRSFEESAIPSWQTKFQSWHIVNTTLQNVTFQFLEDDRYAYEADIQVEHETNGTQHYHVTGRLVLIKDQNTWKVDGFLEKTSLYALLENDYRTVE